METPEIDPKFEKEIKDVDKDRGHPLQSSISQKWIEEYYSKADCVESQKEMVLKLREVYNNSVNSDQLSNIVKAFEMKE